MNEETRTSATLGAAAKAMDLIGKQREETLAQIAQSLSVMLGSAVALVDGMGNVVGYQIKTGALHRVLGYMAGIDHPVTVPLCRTQIVLNHESSPWPLKGKAGVSEARHQPFHPSDADGKTQEAPLQGQPETDRGLEQQQEKRDV